MNTDALIISNLQKKIGFNQPVDFLSDWKGMPVVITGRVQEVRERSVVFQVDAPDSIILAQKDQVLLLHNFFNMGIQANILVFDPQNGIAELGDFSFVDRGYGYRSVVRVEPDPPISGTLVLNETVHSCQVLDISLNGFGLLADSDKSFGLAKGQSLCLKLSLLGQEIEIPGTLLGILPKGNSVRLAISFAPNAPNHAIVRRYISDRRVEIRQEIQADYQLVIGQLK